ncbi:MAG: hypothetical protein V5A57_00935 [Candidatus Paceibacterota bacterium]
MAKKYSKDELWDVYEKLPEELQEAIFSPDTAERIKQACERAGVDKNSEVARYTGQVLMGLLTPKEFKQTLKEDLELSAKQVRSIYREINRFILMPIRDTLSALYGTEIKPTQKPQGAKEPEQTNQQDKASKDKYRESIE